MKIKPLFAALVAGGALSTSIWTCSGVQAQDVSGDPDLSVEDYESSAPGKNPEIPELESSTEIDVPLGVEPTSSFETSDTPNTNTFEETAGLDSEEPFEAQPTTVRRLPVRPERLDPKTFNKSEKKLATAIRTVEDFMGNPKTKIEAALLQQSEGILIFPNIFQAGFFFGGRRGTGVLVLRNNDGTWSHPAFVSITGGSLGLQIGAKSSDLILVFPRRRMVHDAFAGSYKLGGNVAGTAGALDRSAVETEFSKDKIYAISRSSGLYGGVSLEGAELNFNRKRNREFYGEDLTPREIFADIPYVETPRLVPPLQTLLSEVETGTFRLF